MPKGGTSSSLAPSQQAESITQAQRSVAVLAAREMKLREAEARCDARQTLLETQAAEAAMVEPRLRQLATQSAALQHQEEDLAFREQRVAAQELALQRLASTRHDDARHVMAVEMEKRLAVRLEEASSTLMMPTTLNNVQREYSRQSSRLATCRSWRSEAISRSD